MLHPLFTVFLVSYARTAVHTEDYAATLKTEAFGGMSHYRIVGVGIKTEIVGFIHTEIHA